MNKTSRSIIVALIVTSPIWLGYFFDNFHKSVPEDWSFLGIVFAVVIGVPVIGVTGLIGSFLTRKSQNSNTISLLFYLVPALIIGGLEFMVLLG